MARPQLLRYSDGEVRAAPLPPPPPPPYQQQQQHLFNNACFPFNNTRSHPDALNFPQSPPSSRLLSNFIEGDF
ncbi:conserved hypothetical protein [Ricinus communis]|uniref:Uncharacterized protein n=1 Tax=Ricinus communis TaxID=3988 RepID=B9RQ01_RICCO|nr:conserved hypothetical protein [Ricinus communis]